MYGIVCINLLCARCIYMDQYQANYGDQQNEQPALTWVCPKCHGLNQKDFCSCCGYKRRVPKPFNPWKIVSIVLIVFIVLFGIFLFSPSDPESEESKPVEVVQPKAKPEPVADSGCRNGHNFASATCEKPKTCKDCNETEGDALGHDYSPATCEQAARCTRCLKTDGEALSHDWQPATSSHPETCSKCGMTRGNVKGYYEYFPGDYKSTTASVAGTVSRPWVFDEKIENCKEFTLHYQIVEIDYGKAYGKFSLYYKKANGKWEKIGSFEVKDKSEIVKTFKFDDPISFKELAVVAPYRSSFSFTSRVWFDNWYLEE